MRSLTLFALLALGAGCFASRGPLEARIAQLHSDKAEEREAAFQHFSRAPVEAASYLKRFLETGHAQGFPIAALLYNMGQGDAVPLEIKVLHVARFEWPRGNSDDNAIIEPFVWNAVERDILRVGRPALRLLAGALERDAPDDARAIRVARLMVRLAAPWGRDGAAEFARLLEARPIAARVAGAALLHLGYQDATLAATDDPAGAARTWWALARDKSEDEWILDGAARAVERLSNSAETARWTSYLSLILGQDFADSAAARATWEELWKKPPSEWTRRVLPASDSAGLARALKGASRGVAFHINRELERSTRVRLDDRPAGSRVEDLADARVLWAPDPALGIRWERYLEGKLLRLAAYVLGRHPDSGQAGVLWSSEKYFHGTEDETGGGTGSGSRGEYVLYLQSRAFGTRVILSEYVGDDMGTRGSTRSFDVDNETPVIVFSDALKSCVVVVLEDRPARSPTPATSDLGNRLLRLLETPHAAKAARAMGYLNDRALAETLLTRTKTAKEPELIAAIAGALVMLDDPRGLDLAALPRLTSDERELARAHAKDERVRAFVR